MEEKVLAEIRKSWGNLLKNGQDLVFHKGQVLFYEGHVPYGLFVVTSGQVRFSREKSRDSVDAKCREKEHHWNSPKGHALGLGPFFDEAPYCCTCTASEDCRVVFISKMQLLPFITEKKARA